MGKIKVFLVDDHTIVRNGLRSIIEDVEDMEVSGESPGAEWVLKNLENINIDVLMADITMPGITGIELVKEISKKKPAIKSLMLSMHNNEEYILKSIEAGALGYILKDSSREEMLNAIRAVSKGEKYFSLPITDVIVDVFLKKNRSEEKIKTERNIHLSKREKEILMYLIEGTNSRAIAEALEISVRTVDNHRANIMKRLQVKNTAELVKLAVEGGWLK